MLRHLDAINSRQEGVWSSKNGWNKLAHRKPKVLVDLLEKKGAKVDSILAIPERLNGEGGGDLLLLHHCFAFNESGNEASVDPNHYWIVGINGMAKHAPLSTVRASTLCELQDLNSRRKFVNLGATSLEQFVKCTSRIEFKGLRSKSSSAAEDFEGWPNHFWVPPGAL